MGASADNRIRERTQPKIDQDQDFPLFLVLIRGERKFMSKTAAARALNEAGLSMFNSLSGAVLERDFRVRDITEVEKRAVIDLIKKL